MDGVAIGVAVALAGATLNATWNLRLKVSGDPLRLAARAIPLGTLATAPLVGAAWLVTDQPGMTLPGWILAVASGLVQVAYFYLLSMAYRRGEVSSVYPTARGTAPVMVVLLGVFVLGEELAMPQWIAVGMLVAGVWLVRPGVASGSALLPALAVGVCIAGYSALDRLGVQAGPWWLYGWVVFGVTSVCLWPWGRRPVVGALTIGMLMAGSYGMVVLALSLAPLAIVGPVRLVGGVVLVSAWGLWRLGEREAVTRRLLGIGAVGTGAVLLVL